MVSACPSLVHSSLVIYSYPKFLAFVAIEETLKIRPEYTLKA